MNKDINRSLTSIHRGESSWVLPEQCQEIFKDLEIGNRIGSGLWGAAYEICRKNRNQIRICDLIIKLIPIHPIVSPYVTKAVKEYIDGRKSLEDYKSIVNQNRYSENSRYSLDRRREDLDREVAISNLASNAGISPKVHKTQQCSGVLRIPELDDPIEMGFILMERWDTTLNEFLTRKRSTDPNYKLPSNLVQQLNEKIKLLHSLGVTHNDLHTGNIVLNLHTMNNIYEPYDIAIIDFGYARMYSGNIQSNAAYVLEVEKDNTFVVDLGYVEKHSSPINSFKISPPHQFQLNIRSPSKKSENLYPLVRGISQISPPKPVDDVFLNKLDLGERVPQSEIFPQVNSGSKGIGNLPQEFFQVLNPKYREDLSRIYVAPREVFNNLDLQLPEPEELFPNILRSTD